MRKAWWIGSVIVSAALVLPALAQQSANTEQAKQFFTGVNPRNINTVKIDPSKAMRGTNLGQALKPPTAQRSAGIFSLGSYFPHVTVASWPPKLPTFSKVQTPALPKSTTAPRSSVSLFNKPPQ